TSVTHSYNLKNTGTFQITWSGSPTHSANGVAFNGTNQYGNTNFAPAERVSIGVYLNGGTLAGATWATTISRDNYYGGNNSHHFIRVSTSYGGGVNPYVAMSQNTEPTQLGSTRPAPFTPGYGIY